MSIRDRGAELTGLSAADPTPTIEKLKELRERLAGVERCTVSINYDEDPSGTVVHYVTPAFQGFVLGTAEVDVWAIVPGASENDEPSSVQIARQVDIFRATSVIELDSTLVSKCGCALTALAEEQVPSLDEIQSSHPIRPVDAA